LELSGEATASAKLKDFEKIRAGGLAALKQALEFERDVLDVAAGSFELLTPLELADLKRLQEDRNRCAHPSMQSIDEAYQPTAELARSHIRNAVDILLSREPIQGKAALDRLLTDVSSEYFPTSGPDARKRFEHGPLRRARKALIRNLLVVLAKRALQEKCTAPQRKRVHAAIGGIVELHRAEGEAVLSAELPRIAEGVQDPYLLRVLWLANRVPVSWQYLGDSAQDRVTRLVKDTQDEKLIPTVVRVALEIPALEVFANNRVESLSENQFASVVAAVARPEFVARSISLLAGAKSFRHAESLLEDFVLPLAEVLTASDVSQVLATAAGNGEIWDAAKAPRLLVDLFDSTAAIHAECKPHWQALRTALSSATHSQTWNARYTSLQDRMNDAGM
jgi:hypothetical protein